MTARATHHSRKSRFTYDILQPLQAKVGFVDVGSGGPLKEPWQYIPEDMMARISIEPTDQRVGLPVCISNRLGKGKFYVAHDERGSSLHEPLNTFAQRFGQETILTKKVIDVELTTLDHMLANRMKDIDAIDINTEGHDFHVLQGASRILTEGFVKLLKVEFELTGVWKDQGWFSDIDALCRQHGFELIKMDIDTARPVNVRDISHQGEPLWGKAYYAPGRDRWQQMLKVSDQPKREAFKSVALFTIADVPGRAFDVLDACPQCATEERQAIKKKIKDALRFNIVREFGKDTVRFLKGPLRIIKYCMS